MKVLPKKLLTVKRRGSKITPEYADLSQHRKLAEKILEIFKENIGKKRTTLSKRLEELEQHDTYKMVRGLAELVERRCTFKIKATLPPEDVRNELFKRGFVTSSKEKQEVLEKVAKHFNVTPQEVHRSFWADLEKEQVLTNIDLVPPEKLLRAYNFSLTQTLLFDATSLQFRVSSNFQEVFRQIKFLGLMYNVEERNGQLHVQVTGPSAIIRKTRKYGTNMAKLLPAIFRAKQWWIQAKIERKVGNEPRLYTFQLDSAQRNLFGVEPVKQQYDSLVEKNFARKLRVAKGWQVQREPGILKAEKKVMIPDFLLEKRSLKKYVEIVGFWTPEYLSSKLNKLKAIDKEILLLINRKLKCTKQDFKQKQENIIFYDRKIPTREILRNLRKLEEKNTKAAVKKIQQPNIELEDGKTIKQIATQRQWQTSTAKTLTEDKVTQHEDWYLLDGRITHEKTLKDLEQRISKLSTKNYLQAKEILDAFNLGGKALEKIGYQITWHGLDPKKAILTPKNSQRKH